MIGPGAKGCHAPLSRPSTPQLRCLCCLYAMCSVAHTAEAAVRWRFVGGRGCGCASQLRSTDEAAHGSHQSAV
eukprot:COSAG01_NODE_3103_length_6578_cov_112.775428_2_plen_73_part_00